MTTAPHANGETLFISGLIFSNDVGGTETWKGDPIAVEVIDSTFNRKHGWRFKGKVLDEAATATLRQQGTTGFTPEHYAQYEGVNPGIVETTRAAQRDFDPASIGFGLDDIAPAPTPRP